MFKEERVLKKQKIEYENTVSGLYLFSDYGIVIEIAKFIEKFKDFFNLAMVNKLTFQTLMKENYYLLSELLKSEPISNINFPDYLLNNLECLNLIQVKNLNNLHNFTKLKYLKIDDKEYKLLNDEMFKNLTNLEELEIKDSNVNGTGFSYFKEKLRKLSLTSTRMVTDKFLMELQNLNELKIDSCQNIKGECLQQLQQLTILNAINQHNWFNSDYLNNLVNLQQLIISDSTDLSLDPNYILRMQGIRVTGLNDKSLNNLRNLKELIICDNHFLHFNGDCFMNLNNLESLQILSSGLIIKEENFKYLLNLKKLHIFSRLNGEYFNYLTKLEHLSVTLNTGFKEEYLQHLFNLRFLEIENAGSGFEGKYLNNFLNLTHLNVNRSEVKDEYLDKLINLTHLDIFYCKNITGECLLKLINLKYLNISKTSVSERFLLNLSQLVTLEADRCPNITNGNFLLNLNSLLKFVYNKRNYEEKEILEIKSLISEKQNTLHQIAGVLENNNEENSEESDREESGVLYFIGGNSEEENFEESDSD
ncbi:hypothetical protein ABK040_009004 [Willaertia magna]